MLATGCGGTTDVFAQLTVAACGALGDSFFVCMALVLIINFLELTDVRSVFEGYLEDHRDLLYLLCALAGEEYAQFAPLAQDIRFAWRILADHNGDVVIRQVQDAALGEQIRRHFGLPARRDALH